MDDAGRPEESDPTSQDVGPVFDKEAARRRYRATMRSPAMRAMYVLLAIVILTAWAFGGAAAFAPEIAPRPGHEPQVLPRQCIACHTQPTSSAPPMRHIAAPSCGFCHRLAPHTTPTP